MLRSLYAGVSGLRVHQVKMDVISNNIANVNTTGFKGSTVSFKEMFSQTMRAASQATGDRGGMNPMQVGLGVGLGSIDSDFSQGNLQATGKMTDIAIDGNGFFVIKDGGRNVFTRAGVFTFDETGTFIHRTTGFKVQGWMADANGKMPDLNPSTMEDLTLGELTMSPTATTFIKWKGNLDTNKAIVDLTYGPEKVNISDAAGRTGELYIETRKMNGAGTADRADDRWEWVASTDVRERGNTLTVAASPTNIGHTDIRKGTVVVTDATGTTTYTEGTDYRIDYAAGTIEILGGNITMPADLRIDYDHTIEVGSGEITVDERGAVKTTSTASFTMDITDGNGDDPLSITVEGPKVGQINGGSFSVVTAGVNAGKIEGEYGPMMTTSQKVFDSKGTEHTINVSFVKTGENRWDWFATPPLDENGQPIPLTNSTGTIFFDNAGKVMGDPSGGPISFQPNGSDRISITPDFTAITQFDDEDSATAYDADGYEAGSLSSFSIDASGTIIGQYTNGLNRNIGKLAVANFSNAAGLVRAGDTVFVDSNNSGAPDYGIAETSGRGEISAGTLEMSNVDLADQFTEMITTQRGFQASSKIIQTADQILQDLVNLKR